MLITFDGMNFFYHTHFIFDAFLESVGKYTLPALEVTSSEIQRMDYCNQLQTPFGVVESPRTIKAFSKTAYSYDLLRCLWHAKEKGALQYLFGDITQIPNSPTIVKSRPIDGNKQNSVIVPLETERHLFFPQDRLNYKSKSNMGVWRGACYQTHRKLFIESVWQNERVNVGDTARKKTDQQYWKPYLSVAAQRRYKIIISLEGNDVASNLKWAMHSNSVVLMPLPKYETWFCEGFLKPYHHFVPLRDDYSDLDKQVDWILSDDNRALEIIRNAHAYTEQYTDRKRQFALGGLVLDLYFKQQLTK